MEKACNYILVGHPIPTLFGNTSILISKKGYTVDTCISLMTLLMRKF